jgi:hypothetical protein
VRLEHGVEIRDRYEAGEYLSELAAEYGITPGSVARIVRDNGGAIRSQGFGGLRGGTRLENNPSWKGGAYLKNGYRYVLVPRDHPLYRKAAKGYVLEHRLVMSDAVGRPLRSDETVHHINGDCLDNRLENLQLRNGRHGRGSRWRCSDCGSHNIAPVEL